MNISTFGEDEDGEIYLADYFSGAIHRLESVNGPTPDLGSSTFTPDSPTADRLATVTFTITLKNTGAAASNLMINNPLPAGLSYSGALNASAGTASELGGTITWSGGVPSQGEVTIRYNGTVGAGVENGSLLNHAVVSGAGVGPLSLTAELWVPKTALATTTQNFHLPGTQPGGLNSPLQTSADCDICHSASIYDRWRGSVMSQAGRDPLMWSALAVSNAYAPGSGEYCLRCHTNKGWLEGRSSPANGSALTGVDLANGVACLTCHRMVDVIASPNDEASAIDTLVRSALDELPPANTSGSAMLILDPGDNRRGPFSLASTFPYHSARRTDLLGQAGSAETRSRLCGNCHNVRNPLLSL